MNRDTIVNAVAAKLATKDLSNQAVQILKTASDKVVLRAKQNLDIKLRENPAAFIQSFAENISKSIMDSAQSYTKKCGDIDILPEGTKFIKRHVNYVTIVVEQQPQTRTLSFATNPDQRVPVKRTVALPYVQFVFTIDTRTPREIGVGRGDPINRITHAYVVATKQPIKNLDQAIYQLPLPNVSDGGICGGNMSRYDDVDVSESIKKYIGSFWQSVFNHDHPDGFKWFLHNNNITLEQWEVNSKQNPLFMLQAKLQTPNRNRTLRGLITTASNEANQIQNLSNQIKTDILKALGTIGADVQKILGETKLELNGTNHAETLQNILKELIIQAYSELWEYLQKQLQDEKTSLVREKENFERKTAEAETKFRDLIGRITNIANEANNRNAGNEFKGKPSYKYS